MASEQKDFTSCSENYVHSSDTNPLTTEATCEIHTNDIICKADDSCQINGNPVPQVEEMDISNNNESISKESIISEPCESNIENPIDQMSDPKSLIFNNLTFIFSSNSSPLTNKYRSLIEINGGKFSEKLTKSIDYLLVFPEDEKSPNQRMIRTTIPLIKISYIDETLAHQNPEPSICIENYTITIENEYIPSSSSASEYSDQEPVITPRKRRSNSTQNTPTTIETPTRRSSRIRSVSSLSSPSISPIYSPSIASKRSRKPTRQEDYQSSELLEDKENLAQVNVLIETPISPEKMNKDSPIESTINEKEMNQPTLNSDPIITDTPVIPELELPPLTPTLTNCQ